jgi:hypothetical protein
MHLIPLVNHRDPLVDSELPGNKSITQTHTIEKKQAVKKWWEHGIHTHDRKRSGCVTGLVQKLMQANRYLCMGGQNCREELDLTKETTIIVQIIMIVVGK